MHSIGLGSIDEVMSRSEAYARLLELPDNQVGEILGGDLVVSPRPAMPHALAAGSLHSQLEAPFQRARAAEGGWWILFEPELHLEDDVLVPDLAGWRTERLPELPDVTAMTLAPDWVCEIVSPSTAANDRVRKMPIYAREGVGHVWLVDPQARALEVFRLESGVWQISAAWAGGEHVVAEPFDAIRLDLAKLWLPKGP